MCISNAGRFSAIPILGDKNRGCCKIVILQQPLCVICSGRYFAASGPSDMTISPAIAVVKWRYPFSSTQYAGFSMRR